MIFKEYASKEYVNEKIVDSIGNHKYSWNDLEDKPVDEVFISTYDEATVTASSSTQSITLSPPLGYLGEDKKIHTYDKSVVDIHFNGVLIDSLCDENGTFQIDHGSYNYEGQKYTYMIMVDRTNGLRKMKITLPPLSEDTVVRATYRYPKYTLKDEYISDSIARVEDVESIIGGLNISTESDWNANEGESGYIKNRTHYESTNYTIIVDNFTYTSNFNQGWTSTAFNDVILEDGVKYTVHVDGRTYVGTALLDNFTGNVTFHERLDEYQGYFRMYYVEEDNHTVCEYNDGKSHNVDKEITILIYRMDDELKQLDEKFIPNTIARVANVKPDWNANDGEAGYIKNRTHYEEINDEVIIDNQTYVFNNAYGLWFGGENNNELKLIVGHKYDVIWDDILYENLTCVVNPNQETMVIIGPSVNIPSQDLETPFYIGYDTHIEFITTLEGDTHTISIIERNSIVHAIEEKYIPNTIARISNIESLTASDVGAIPVPTTAEVGQTIRVSAVDENGVPTAWEAVNMPGLHRALRLTLTENVAVISVTGLSLKLPATIALSNAGDKAGTGIALKINGIEQLGYTGSLSGSSTEKPQVMTWLFTTSTNKMGSYTRMSNGGRNTMWWSDIPKTINSIEIDSPYRNDGINNYFQNGTILEIYEGVYPNVYS